MSAAPANLPSPRDENWKYANLRGVARARFESSPAPSAEDLARVAAALPKPLSGYERVVLVDGHSARSLSTLDCAGLAQRAESISSTDRYFLHLNQTHRTETQRIVVAANTRRAIELVVVSLGTSHPAIEIEVGAGGALSLIERHLSLGTAVTITNVALVGNVGAHATLELSRIGHHGPKAQFLDTIDLQFAEGAIGKVVQLTAGGAATRTTAFIEHAGRDASLEWHSSALGEGSQHHDTFVRVAHAAPGARTLQQFRGIASGRSRIGFNGHMRVEATAIGAQSDQSLKCLLAGTEAEADVRPQLEIYTDAVKASHGATVGKLDPDMLFYLLSRGIPEEAAASLLKWAFVSDVLARLPSASLRTEVDASLERLLPGAVASRAGT